MVGMTTMTRRVGIGIGIGGCSNAGPKVEKERWGVAPAAAGGERSHDASARR